MSGPLLVLEILVSQKKENSKKYERENEKCNTTDPVHMDNTCSHRILRMHILAHLGS